MITFHKVRLTENNIKYVLYVIFICGWLIPKLSLFSVNVGIQEVVAIAILLYKYKVKKWALKIFRADLFFVIFLFLYGGFYVIRLGDIEGFLIGCRTLLFAGAALGLSSLSLSHLLKTTKTVGNIYMLFIIISVGRILINIFLNSFDPINFFYGSDSYRVKAPFDNGGASSQVPIGYMIALMMCVPTLASTKFRKLFIMLGAIGTTSRAAILSIVIVTAKKINFKSIGGIISIGILAILMLAVYVKSFSLNEGELDGSANKRLTLYVNSVGLMIEHPESVLLGFGLSSKALADATGEGFYESFIFNSLMQGGIIMVILSFWILIKTFYFDYKYNLYSTSIVVFLGNALGGSNYFSMFAFPFFVLIVCLAMRNNLLKNS